MPRHEAQRRGCWRFATAASTPTNPREHSVAHAVRVQHGHERSTHNACGCSTRHTIASSAHLTSAVISCLMPAGAASATTDGSRNVSNGCRTPGSAAAAAATVAAAHSCTPAAGPAAASPTACASTKGAATAAVCRAAGGWTRRLHGVAAHAALTPDAAGAAVARVECACMTKALPPSTRRLAGVFVRAGCIKKAQKRQDEW